MRNAFDSEVASMSMSTTMTTTTTTTTISTMTEVQEANYDEYLLDLQRQFAEWEAGEEEAFNQFMDDCKDAWKWIKISYCLKHGDDDDVTHAGYGCNWAYGAGDGNAGFKKGIAVEEHMDVLSMGQELDIKHIRDEAGLIASARDFAMEGVAQEAARLLAAMDPALRAAALSAESSTLEQTTIQTVTTTVTTLKEEVPRQAAALLERDTQAVAAVDADRLQRIEFMDNMREQALWDIKEAVWKLGYPTGYRLGDDEEGEFYSRESEILAEITALREAFEEQVEGTLSGSAERIAAEKAAAEAAYLAAQAEIDAVQESQRVVSEQAITTVTQNLESAFSGASADCAADAAAAREALRAFIDGRLAEWGDLYAREERTAKW